MRALPLAILLLAGTLPAAARADEKLAVVLKYKVFFGGMSAATIDVDIAVDRADYRITATTVSESLMNWLTSFRSRAESRGGLRAGNLQLASHHSDGMWRGNPRSTRIIAVDDGTLQTTIAPPPEDDERDPVPQEKTRGAVDLLTASLAAIRTFEQRSVCDQRVPVFDGRRRYDLVFAETTAESVKSPYYTGPATRCRMDMDRIAGFSRRPFLSLSDEPPVTRVWIARLDPRLPPIPVKMEVDSTVTTIVYLETFTQVSTGVPATPAEGSIAKSTTSD